MEQLSPHQAWQEVKKIQKFLSALNQTEETLRVLAEYDSLKNKLMSEIPMLEKEIDDKAAEIDTAEKKLEDMKVSYEKVRADILSAHQMAEMKMAEMKMAANKQVEDMKARATEEVTRTKADLARLLPEVEKLKLERKELELAIENLKKQAADQVSSLVGAFKSLG